MDDVSRAYFEMYGYSIINEMVSHDGEVKYQLMKEEVDTEAIKDRIHKAGKEASNPERTRKDVEKLHDKRRKEINKLMRKEEYRSDISLARSAVSAARKRAKEHPGIHKGDDTEFEHRLNKNAFKNLVKQEREKRSSTSKTTPVNNKSLKEEVIDEVKTTYLPKSRERDIGKHDDWKDPHPDTRDWGEKSPKAKKLVRRAVAVIGTQRRQDKEVGLRKEEMELIISYLLENGYADTEKSAENIMVAMSENWLAAILDETLS
jgi:hypothetical protein